MPITETLPTLPFERSAVLELAPGYYELQRQRPVTRVRTPAGDTGWLVTGYEDVKRLLADPRLGRGHADPDNASRYSRSMLEGGPIGDPATEDEEYGRMRKLLSPAFAPRRIQALHAEIQHLVDDSFEEMMSGPRPGDFHASVAYTLPIMVICRLLGVPADHRDQFGGWFDAATALYDLDRAASGFEALMRYTDELVALKRAEPGNDLISDLLSATEGSDADAYLPQLVAGMLYAGHETTAERLDFGVLHLLTNTEQRAALRENPDLMPGAVDEVLRVAAPSRPPRIAYARENVEAGGVVFRTGELVMLASQAANHDASVFPDPARFDITRNPNPHLSFGYGGHFCLGASLAKSEMERVFAAVLRHPTLRPAVPLGEMLEHENPATGGLKSFPVTW